MQLQSRSLNMNLPNLLQVAFCQQEVHGVVRRAITLFSSTSFVRVHNSAAAFLLLLTFCVLGGCASQTDACTSYQTATFATQLQMTLVDFFAVKCSLVLIVLID